MIFLEQSIWQGIQWAVFELNGPALWAAVSSSIQNFLPSLWQSGALQGATEQAAFSVRCHPFSMTQNDIDKGRLIVIVGVAPLRPAEFVLIQITIQTRLQATPPAH
jgi:uncharacterized protein